jgi:uncharacterized glyoxalase superfamily protein PhnB
MAAEQRAIPMISYENVAQAVQSLTRMFGFQENADQRFTEPDGRVSHAELDLDGAKVMLGTPGPDYQSPKHHRSSCEVARRWSEMPFIIDGVFVTVGDVNAHFKRAKDQGATILSQPVDEPYGIRQYRAEDPEGHRWMFGQPI